MIGRIASWPRSSASRMTSSDTSVAPASTMTIASRVAAMTRSSLLSASCGHRWIDDEVAVDVSHANGADRPLKRNIGDRQRGRGAVDGQHVRVILPVDRQGRDDDLNIVAESLGKERANWPIGQARYQNRLGAGSAFSLDIAARDLTSGVHSFFVVDGQGKEIDIGSGILRMPSPWRAPRFRRRPR